MDDINIDNLVSVSIIIKIEKLKEWYELLGKSGSNTKAQVREEIGEILKTANVL